MDHINPNQQEPHLKCPRCDSNNTKFCYYNNYNLSQPRHYCKHCRRYWTKGGTLRNIPVGGATRKITKRSSNQNKKASQPVMMTSPPPAQPSPPPQPPKTEASVGYGFSSILGFGSNSMGAFGNLLMDGLSSYNNNLVSKSNEDDNVLIRNSIAADDLLRLNDESDHRNQNRNENDDENGSERGGGEWNGIGWPDLSIFTPAAGSSFQ